MRLVPDFTVHSADIRDVTQETLGLVSADGVAANIPYYITGEIIRQFNGG